LNLYNICFYRINNLPNYQVIYYLLYKLYDIKIKLKPEVFQNFIYNNDNNIIEIDFEKYTLQSFIIINDFIKPKILELFNTQLENINKLCENNEKHNFDKLMNINNDEKKQKNHNTTMPYIFIFHNINKLSENTLQLLLNLIKTSYYKTNLIRFIISSNTHLNIKQKSILFSFDIICQSMDMNLYHHIYDYIYKNNYINLFNELNDEHTNISYNDNDNDIMKYYLTQKKYLQIYPYYEISNVNNILIYLLNIDNIYILKKYSKIKDKSFDDDSIKYLKNRIYQIPAFEKSLYNLLNIIIFNSKPLINIINNINEMVNVLINYDVNIYMYIKLLTNYFKIIVNFINKKTYKKQYNELLNILPKIYKLCAKYEIIQNKSKFIHDFIVYEQILIHIYKLFYKHNFYKISKNILNEKIINDIISNDKILPLQLV
jgi:hypothetical protein